MADRIDHGAAEWAAFGAALRERRNELGLSLRDLAEQTHWTFSLLAQWERGEKHPDPEAVKRLDTVLAAGGGLTVAALVAEAAEVGGLRAELRRVRKGKNHEKFSASDKEHTTERRRLMQEAATVAAVGAIAPILSALTDAWQASEPTLPGASVSRSMIVDWEEAADIHASRARLDPPAVVLAALAVDYAAMAPHLRQEQPGSVQRELAHAAARHTALIAGKWIDLGNRREAHRWWLTTRTLSDRSGDTLLASWLRSREALYRRGDPEEDPADLLQLAQDARRLAGKQDCVPLVGAVSAEAQILATMGRYEEAVKTLHWAEEIFDRLPAFGGEWCAWAGRGLCFDQSLIYTLAGDVKRATQAQDVLLRGFADKDVSTVQVRLHRAALDARTDPAMGIDQAIRIIDSLSTDARRTRYLQAARVTLDALPERARSLPAAQELHALTSA